MKEYELMYIIKPNISQEQAQEIVENLKKTFIKNKDINCFEEIIPASIELKELAYPIKKFQQGYYVQSTIKADNTFVEKFNQLMQITEEILRFLIIKK
ncbi:MAG: 30S ribosomal protein S6 [Sweet potato little leaf phytoplasma]|uniref:Small ribosomal subunit protein bS6 n=4 Tax=Candidatus Phytoplasma TaxID=33926 RepID=A0A9K3Y5H8_9MOLU|nr:MULTISPECIES: 30S ribosomal protein S6 [Phytoplasma]QLL37095.1 30S ribosomal protein S6 ['Echinacea purpurea' witches'-broom phytoplasma]UQV26699.1 30S ribosomal protein S6 ['Parthenium sp.' phyllody phytoplasma]WEX20640.1 MAG: 30S ribosomal protein S6 [Candidatus Phytoplasma aurantifolia]EMR14489.1 30S ribosomal protein S6 [Peanut witches'-broom phytoplasma NTU2011]MCG3566736.1 30S ribosomal protein S6 [Sesame phyllody phytoplasma]